MQGLSTGVGERVWDECWAEVLRRCWQKCLLPALLGSPSQAAGCGPGSRRSRCWTTEREDQDFHSWSAHNNSKACIFRESLRPSCLLGFP